MSSQTFNMSFVGYKELQERLSTLSKIEYSGVLRKAIRDSQNLMKKAAKSNAKGMVGGDMGGKIADNIVLRKLKKKKGQNGLMCMIDAVDNEDGWFIHVTKDNVRYWIPTAIEYGHVVAAWGRSMRMAMNVPYKTYKRWTKKQKLSKGYRFVPPIPFFRSASDNTIASRFGMFAHMINTHIIRLWTRKVTKAHPELDIEKDDD